MKNQLLFEFLRVKYGPPLQKLEFHFCILCGGRGGGREGGEPHKKCNKGLVGVALGLLYVQEVLLCMYKKCNTKCVWRCGSCSMYQFLLPDFDSSDFLIL